MGGGEGGLGFVDHRAVARVGFARKFDIPVAGDGCSAEGRLDDGEGTALLRRKRAHHPDLGSEAALGLLVEVAVLASGLLGRVAGHRGGAGLELQGRPLAGARTVELVRGRIAHAPPEHRRGVLRVGRELFRIGVEADRVGLSGDQNEVAGLGECQSLQEQGQPKGKAAEHGVPHP